MTEPNAIRIVPLARGYVHAIARLEKRCFSRPWTRPMIEEELKNPLTVFLVAVQGNRLAGYGSMRCVIGEGYINNIATDDAFRHRGVGRALTKALIAAAQHRGLEFLSLEVRLSNAPAIALYQSEGFVKEGRRRDFYQDPMEDALIMTRWFHEQSNG